MPHTSRRRAAVKNSTKLTTVSTSSDGWSTIVRQGEISAHDDAHSRRISRLIPAESEVDALASHLSRTSLSAQQLSEGLTPAQLAYYYELTSSKSLGQEKSYHEGEEYVRSHPSPQQPRCTKEELQQQYSRIQKLWQKSAARGAVKNMFRLARVIANDEVEVDDFETEPEIEQTRATVKKAICLGLGSPSADASGWRRVVLWQLVVFVDMVRMLETADSNHDSSIRIFAQDPIFNTVDHAFLTSLEIEPLTHGSSPFSNSLAPTSNSLSEESHSFVDSSPSIDCTTLVFGPHFPLSCWPSAMRQGEAALVIGNDIEGGLPRIPTATVLRTLFSRVIHDIAHHNDTTPDVESLLHIPDLEARNEFETFIQSHESMAWPEPEEAESSFNNMKMYWRRSGFRSSRTGTTAPMEG